MRRSLSAIVALCAAAATPAAALSPGDTVLVPAAGRVNEFVTDLYVANPGDTTVQATVYWLERDQDNSALDTSFDLDILPGETAVLADVIFEDFGLTEGAGAFLVAANDDVVVNSRIYAVAGGATFGQGFEGVPAPLATQSGGSALVVGLSQNASFRSNVYALAGDAGVAMTLRLLDPSGVELASRQLALDGYEPYLQRVDRVFNGLADFDDGTLQVEVTAGAAVVGASKVDNQSTDPTTLESSVASGGAAAVSDGTYQIAMYDSAGFASGGNVVISGGEVEAINGTYTNWDKLDGGEPACTLIFQWGDSLAPTPLDDFETGVTFEDDYTSTGSGRMTWTVQLTRNDDNLGLVGTIDAVGADFPSDPDPAFDQSGCNGTFPTQTLLGGTFAD